MEKFDAEKIIAEAKDFVIDRARPLTFRCVRTEEEEKELNYNIYWAMIYLEYVESEIDNENLPLNYREWYDIHSPKS